MEKPENHFRLSEPVYDLVSDPPKLNHSLPRPPPCLPKEPSRKPLTDLQNVVAVKKSSKKRYRAPQPPVKQQPTPKGNGIFAKRLSRKEKFQKQKG